MLYKMSMVVALLFVFSAIAESAEKWRFHRAIKSPVTMDDDNPPFPRTISITRDKEHVTLTLKIPGQTQAKTFSVATGTCSTNETLQSYTDEDSPTVQSQLRERATVCDTDGRILVSLKWNKRERRGKWTPLGVGSYLVKPSSNRNSLMFYLTSTESDSSFIEEAIAEYLK